MPKQTKICRVCGATYEACRSVKNGDGTFNWREVACSPECGMKYLHDVMVSRGEVEAPKKHSKVKHTAKVVLEQDNPTGINQEGHHYEDSSVSSSGETMCVESASASETAEKE